MSVSEDGRMGHIIGGACFARDPGVPSHSPQGNGWGGFRGPALEFALTKLRTSPGAPAFVFHPAPSGWNLLWKRENHTRGPHTFPDTRDKLVESRLNGLKQRGNVWGGLFGVGFGVGQMPVMPSSSAMVLTTPSCSLVSLVSNRQTALRPGWAFFMA